MANKNVQGDKEVLEALNKSEAFFDKNKKNYYWCSSSTVSYCCGSFRLQQLCCGTKREQGKHRIGKSTGIVQHGAI